MCRTYIKAQLLGSFLGHNFFLHFHLVTTPPSTTTPPKKCSQLSPAPLWCRVGNTGIKCKSEADDDAPFADGHFLHQGYIHLQYLQTNCHWGKKAFIREYLIKLTENTITASECGYKFITKKINV